MFEVIRKILENTKVKRQKNDFLGVINNAQAVLDYLPDIINYEVDQEHQYRAFEAELSEQRDDTGKRYTGSYCETKAKATEFYKEYRRAQLFRELMYEVVQISKKLASSIDQNLNASGGREI